MAGMFYSLAEAAEKLNKTEEEVKELAKQGKLREFRDGSSVLFKIEEVEALMAEAGATESVAPVAGPDSEGEEAAIPLEEPKESVDTTESEQVSEQEQVIAPEEPMESEQVPEPEQAEAPEEPIEPEQVPEDEDISLAPETEAPAAEGELTGADTALTGEGVNILGETDSDYQIAEDTMAETTVSPGASGADTVGLSDMTGEASLEEIEEDVNLDTFGSGSGLLDLSLQADDTSLGGILDEIYTSEGEEESHEPAEPGPEVEMPEEAEQMIPEEELAGPQPVLEQPAIVQQRFIETAPDALGSSLGIMLFMPLLALIYAAIVTVAGVKKVMPAVLGEIQSPYVALYIMAGFSIAAVLVFGISYIFSGGLSTAGRTKTKKAKKPKKPKKSRKEKKAKKGKAEAPEE